MSRTQESQERNQASKDYYDTRRTIQEDYNKRHSKLVKQRDKAKADWDKLEEAKKAEYKAEYDKQFAEREKQIQENWNRIQEAEQQRRLGLKKQVLDQKKERQEKKLETIARRSAQQGSQRNIIANTKMANNRLKRIANQMVEEIKTEIQSPEYKEWSKEQWEKNIEPDVKKIEEEAKVIQDKYTRILNNLFKQSQYARTKEEIERNKYDKQYELNQIEYDYKMKLEAIKQKYNPTPYSITVKDKNGNLKFQANFDYQPSNWLIQNTLRNLYSMDRNKQITPNNNIFDFSIGTNDEGKIRLQAGNILNNVVAKIWGTEVLGSYNTRTNQFKLNPNITLKSTINGKTYDAQGKSFTVQPNEIYSSKGWNMGQQYQRQAEIEEEEIEKEEIEEKPLTEMENFLAVNKDLTYITTKLARNENLNEKDKELIRYYKKQGWTGLETGGEYIAPTQIEQGIQKIQTGLDDAGKGINYHLQNIKDKQIPFASQALEIIDTLGGLTKSENLEQRSRKLMPNRLEAYYDAIKINDDYENNRLKFYPSYHDIAINNQILNSIKTHFGETGFRTMQQEVLSGIDKNEFKEKYLKETERILQNEAGIRTAIDIGSYLIPYYGTTKIASEILDDETSLWDKGINLATAKIGGKTIYTGLSGIERTQELGIYDKPLEQWEQFSQEMRTRQDAGKYVGWASKGLKDIAQTITENPKEAFLLSTALGKLGEFNKWAGRAAWTAINAYDVYNSLQSGYTIDEAITRALVLDTIFYALKKSGDYKLTRDTLKDIPKEYRAEAKQLIKLTKSIKEQVKNINDIDLRKITQIKNDQVRNEIINWLKKNQDEIILGGSTMVQKVVTQDPVRGYNDLEVYYKGKNPPPTDGLSKEALNALDIHSTKDFLYPTIKTTTGIKPTSLGFEKSNIIIPKELTRLNTLLKEGKITEHDLMNMQTTKAWNILLRKAIGGFENAMERYSKDIPFLIQAIDNILAQRKTTAATNIPIIKQYYQWKAGRARETIKSWDDLLKVERADATPLREIKKAPLFRREWFREDIPTKLLGEEGYLGGGTGKLEYPDSWKDYGYTPKNDIAVYLPEGKINEQEEYYEASDNSNNIKDDYYKEDNTKRKEDYYHKNEDTPKPLDYYYKEDNNPKDYYYPNPDNDNKPEYDYYPEYDKKEYNTKTITPKLKFDEFKQKNKKSRLDIKQDKRLNGYKPVVTLPNGQKVRINELYPTRILAEARLREILSGNKALTTGETIPASGNNYSSRTPIMRYGSFKRSGFTLTKKQENRKVYKKETANINLNKLMKRRNDY